VDVNLHPAFDQRFADLDAVHAAGPVTPGEYRTTRARVLRTR
jgi:hypothetical protein